jgi:hypothetical protein
MALDSGVAFSQLSAVIARVAFHGGWPNAFSAVMIPKGGRSEEALKKAEAQLAGLITRVCDIANTESRRSMVNWLNTKHSDLL